jgi:membrane-associated protease RseP (regulator of RpoE activity)
VSRLWLHLGLFVASCVTTYWAGGPYFAATLMTILLFHELGHYVVGRRRGVDISLPYFIPFLPQVSFGTFGAVIGMRRPIADRNALFDVGAAGPIAGLVVAIPLLVVGLTLSEIGPPDPNGVIEGNSILYVLVKYAVFGRWLPSDGVDVNLHPMAFAAWVGLLVTAINLMPIGQLDGGHVARAALGERHEVWSGRLHKALPAVGVIVGGVMFVTALRAGEGVLDALSYASHGALPWCMWALLLGWMRRRAGEYHPAVADMPLAPSRRIASIAMLVLFVLIVTPVPLRPVL